MHHLTRWIVGLLVILCSGGMSHAATVQLSWTASPTASVTGYRVYYGVATGVYTVNYDAQSSLTASIGGLAEGTTYYMAVKAYNATGTESVFSNEVTVPITVPGVDPGAPIQVTIMPRVISQ